MVLFDFEDVLLKKPVSSTEYSKYIGVAKFGRSIKFGVDLDQKSNSLGDWEVTNFLSIRSKYEPNTLFIYLTASNFFKLSEEERFLLFPHRNVVSINHSDFSYIDYGDIEDRRNRDIIINNDLVKNISEVWAFAGPNSRTCHCIDGILTKEGTEYKALMMFKRYCGAIYSYLNHSNIKWYHIVTDNRYFIQSYDLINGPTKCFAQSSKDFDYVYKKVKSEKEPTIFVQQKVNVVASDVLALWPYNKKPYTFTKKEFDIVAVANQIKEKGDPRIDLLKKYVVDTKLGTIVGAWEGEENYNILKDSLYNREGLSKNDMESLLKKYKFGLIFNYDTIKVLKETNAKLSNISWLVSKIYEYIYYGVIPIFIEYDTLNNFYELPEELFVKSPKAFIDLIEKFKSIDFDKYAKNLYYKLITPDKLDGSYFYRKGEFSF